MLATASVLGLVGKSWWVFDMFSHFHLQYAVLLGVLIIVLVLTRSRILLIVAVAFLIYNIALVTKPFVANPQVDVSTLPADHETVRIMFANVFFLNTDYEKMADSVRDADPDIFIMAEVDGDAYDSLVEQLPEYTTSLHESDRAIFGLTVFSRVPLEEEIEIVVFGGANLPSLVSTVRVGDSDLKIIGTHTPAPINKRTWNNRNSQLLGLSRYIAELDTEAILIGDYNTTHWSPMYKELERDGGLSQSRDGFGLQVSWPLAAPPFFRIPIDHALITENVAVHDRHLGISTGGDHRPLILDLSVAN